jgi:HEAT repeat protein
MLGGAVFLLAPLILLAGIFLPPVVVQLNRQWAAQRQAEEEAQEKAEKEVRLKADRAEAEARAAAEFPSRVRGWLMALKSGSADERLSALRSLAEAGPRAAEAEPGALASVSALLQDSSGAVREAAFEATVRIGGSPGSVVPGLKAALGSNGPGVRRHAARMLQTLGPEAAPAAPELAACLWDSKVNSVAVAALIAIGKEAVPALEIGLRNKNRVVRARSAQALGKIGPEAAPAVPRLTEMLGVQEDREAAIEALGLIGAPAVPALIAALDSKDAEARRAAAMTLGHIGAASRGALPRLTALAEEEISTRVREVAEVAIRRIKRAR